jgi:hypothetical protein
MDSRRVQWRARTQLNPFACKMRIRYVTDSLCQSLMIQKVSGVFNDNVGRNAIIAHFFQLNLYTAALSLNFSSAIGALRAY